MIARSRVVFFPLEMVCWIACCMTYRRKPEAQGFHVPAWWYKVAYTCTHSLAWWQYRPERSACKIHWRCRQMSQIDARSNNAIPPRYLCYNRTQPHPRRVSLISTYATVYPRRIMYKLSLYNFHNPKPIFTSSLSFNSSPDSHATYAA